MALVPVCLTVFVIVAVAALLRAELRADRSRIFWCKTCASAAFVALGLAAGALGAGTFGAFILLGLVLAACGDVALAIPKERAFTAGLVLFLFGHLAYVAACLARVAVGSLASPRSLVPFVISTAAYLFLWPHLGKMRAPVAAYVVAITVMVSGAMEVFVAAAPGAWPLALGALLFYLSDLSVARDRFVRPGFANRAWGLPAYYAGQILIAWSVAYR